jgi:acetyltransferase-like isoleucine patch superfamily enzyme
MIRNLARTFVWLLPASRAKNGALTRLGHPIHPSATAAPNLVLKVDAMSLGPHSRIGAGNLIKNMRAVRLAEGSSIGRLNVISSHPVYQRLYADGAVLALGAHASVTDRHQLDAAGGIDIGDLACLGGRETKIVSHSIDVRTNVQSAYPVTIGSRTYIDSRCLLLGGASVPERSALGVGSVVPRIRAGMEPGSWAGNPVEWIGPSEGAWFSRSTPSADDGGQRAVVEDPRG